MNSLTTYFNQENIFTDRNLRQVTCHIVAFSITLWCFGKSIPGLGIGIFMGGVFLLFYMTPVLLLKREITLFHKPLFLIFLFLHLIIVNPFGQSATTFDFMIKITASILFFIVLVNVVDDLRLYSRMILVMLAMMTAIAAFLVYLHMFVFHSPYLTTHMTQTDWYYIGRTGKNTLSFFLALLYPFAYARFSHRKTPRNFFSFAIIAFAILYTLSRMAILSLLFSTFLFTILSIRRIMSIKQLVVIALSIFVISTVFEINTKTYLKLRYVGQVSEVESGKIGLLDFGSHRGLLVRRGLEGFLESPFFGHGVTSFRGQKVTGGSLSHNDYLQILYELGFIGFTAFGALLFFSFRDLQWSRKRIPPKFYWLWDGQIVSLLTTFLMLLFINAYETIPVWFVLAGCQILYRVTRVPNLTEVEKTVALMA